MNPLDLFCAMMVAHSLCDYPLQGDFLSKAKNHRTPIPGVPWWQALAAHALMHGGAVWLLTGNVVLGGLEAVCHGVIDHNKCAGRLSFTQDQALHVLCKVIWAAAVVVLAR